MARIRAQEERQAAEARSKLGIMPAVSGGGAGGRRGRGWSCACSAAVGRPATCGACVLCTGTSKPEGRRAYVYVCLTRFAWLTPGYPASAPSKKRKSQAAGGGADTEAAGAATNADSSKKAKKARKLAKEEAKRAADAASQQHEDAGKAQGQSQQQDEPQQGRSTRPKGKVIIVALKGEEARPVGADGGSCNNQAGVGTLCHSSSNAVVACASVAFRPSACCVACLSCSAITALPCLP
jgi:hypothetical protein